MAGLELVSHEGPSTIGIDTLIRSNGDVSREFLRNCGLPAWVTAATTLYRSDISSHQFSDALYVAFDAWTKGKDMINGCFISYSWKNSDFVDKLHEHLRAEGITVWHDRHDMVAGPIQDQVWRAIQVHHAVILVLSSDSTQSDWVENELDMARRKEKSENRPVLCPIALDESWKSKVDVSHGPGDENRQLWRTMVSKNVMDFSAWRTEAFQEVFDKLVRGLRLYYGPKNSPPGT